MFLIWLKATLAPGEFISVINGFIIRIYKHNANNHWFASLLAAVYCPPTLDFDVLLLFTGHTDEHVTNKTCESFSRRYETQKHLLMDYQSRAKKML